MQNDSSTISSSSTNFSQAKEQPKLRSNQKLKDMCNQLKQKHRKIIFSLTKVTTNVQTDKDKNEEAVLTDRLPDITHAHHPN